MNDSTYRTLKHAIWATALTAGITVPSIFSYLKTRDETAVARAQAETQKAQTLSALEAQRLEAFQGLLANPAYQGYLQQRQQFAKELSTIGRFPMYKWLAPAEVAHYTNTAFGEMPLREPQ